MDNSILNSSSCSTTSVLSTDIEPLNCTNDTINTTLSTDIEPLYDSDMNESGNLFDATGTYSTSTPCKDTALPSSSGLFHQSPVVDAQERQTHNKRRRRTFRNPESVLGNECCKVNCMKTLSPLDIEICERTFYELGEAEEKQAILDYIKQHTNLQMSDTSGSVNAQHNFVIRGKTVCDKCWCLAHNVTHQRFLVCVKMYMDGQTRVCHGNLGRKGMREKTTVALGWMRYLFERIGDWMPHRTQVCLPQTYTKKSLYQRMLEELASTGIPRSNIISYEYFTSAWKEHLPEFVIGKGSEFTICTICTTLKEKRQKAATEVEVKEINEMLRSHNLAVEKERREYHTARERARRQPQDLTVIIIDGMDQAKTNVPHFTKRDKTSCNLSRLPVHLTGVLVHTAVPGGKIPIVYTDTKQIPHDSNMTLNCLLNTLRSHKDKLGRSLFLQLDNCFRENKNRYLLAFIAFLIEVDTFEEVVVHFLPVGHTHEDVDQMFSCISSRLKKTDVYTMDDLETQVTQSYSPKVSVHPVTPLYDIKNWLRDHLYGEFRHHSHPHWFKFSKVEGVCRMHWRMWVTSPWEPQVEHTVTDSIKDYSKGLRCLKSFPDITKPPLWVKPTLEKMDVPSLKRDLLSSDGYKLRLPNSAREWWQNFLDNVDEMEEVPPENTSWPLQQLKGLARSRETAVEPTQDNQMQLIRDKVAMNYPPVCIGDQGKTSNRQVTVATSRDTIAVGELVAVHLEGNKGRPYIATVLEKDEASVQVHWMRGSWLKEWKPWNTGTGKNAKPYKDKISLNSVILWGFNLTRKGHLTKATANELKRKYEELDNASDTD